MSSSNKTQLGYFVDFSLWRDALELLNFQIKQKTNNRHFNTLSMFYYESINADCINQETDDYFNTKIASSLFYALEKEFSVFSYVIPKSGLGLRDFKFFTYPMRVVYYTVGLYLLKLSQEFLLEIYKKNKNICSFYGGHLHYKSEKLQLSPKNIYHRSFHQEYLSKIKEETTSDNSNKVTIKLDIENYFNELPIPKLLHFLSRYIKPTTQKNMNYDIFTREQIISLFQFISNGKSGIPQSDNDIISSFIGYLYLVFGDLVVDDILVSYKDDINSHKIIRYTDDIFISITFNRNIDQDYQCSLIHLVSSQIAESLYSELGLKLNSSKTKLYHLSDKEEKEQLLKDIRKSSLNGSSQSFEKEEKEAKSSTETPQDKLDNIFDELEKIKQFRVEEYIVKENSAQKEILQKFLDKSVEQILDKPENRSKLKQIFENFNFDLVKIQALEILIILLKDETTKNEFENFCLKKSIITTGDADLIIKFLCQTNFSNSLLLEKLKQNVQMKNIVDVFMGKKSNCETPGYYKLSCMKMKELSQMPEVIEQTRLRILSEKSESYSVALNHLVNEIHAICIKQEKSKQKDYDVNDVFKFLRLNNIQNEICTKIRNLFDRRNSNSISHPGSTKSLAWEVTKQEYLEYREYVGKCIECLL